MSTTQDRSASATKRQPRELSAEQKKQQEVQDKIKEALKKKKKVSLWDKYSYHIILGGFGFIVVATLLSTLFGKTKKLHLTPVIESDEIETHNSEDYTYKLGPNLFFEGWTLADAKKILNNHFAYKQSLHRCTGLEEGTILEKNYDFREKYPECVSPVIDQRNCSSSFAVASASAISDRLCIASGNNVRLSAQHFLSCQEDAKGNECNGGSIASFLEFATKKGIVDEQCINYHGEPDVACPANVDQCEKHYLSDYCIASTVEGIKREILKNGPVVGYMPIYRDFLIYKNGNYQVLEGTSRFQGGHAVKVIGWGQDNNGGEYWIVENSWGDSWGIKGFAHVGIGQEQTSLDDYAFAPNPKYDKEPAEEKVVEPKADAVNL